MSTEEQRRAVTIRLRARFLQVVDEFNSKSVRNPDIGALLELIIDQAIRIENLEAAQLPTGDLAPTISLQPQLVEIPAPLCEFIRPSEWGGTNGSRCACTPVFGSRFCAEHSR